MPDILLREMDRQLQVREDCSLDLHLTYPCFPRNSALSTHYRREAEGYLAYISRLCRDVLPGLPPGVLGKHLRAERICTVGWARENLISLYFDRYEDMGLYHTALGRRSDLWRMPEGRPVKMEELFCDPAEVRRRIDVHIGREMAADPPGQWFGSWRKQPRWFFLTERGMCIYFRPGDIASGAAGIPAFLIPWAELDGCLNFPL